MRTTLALPLSRSSAVLVWRWPALFLLLALSALGGGIATFVWQQRSESHDVYAGAAAATLVLIGLLQVAIAWREARAAWQGSRSLRRAAAFPQQSIPPAVLARRLFIGLVLCYLLAAATGSTTAAPCVFAAGVMVWLTAALLPLTAHPTTIDIWRRLSQRGGLRRAARIVYLGLLCGVLGELSLRAGNWLWEALAGDEANPVEVALAGGSDVPNAVAVHLVTSPALADGGHLQAAAPFPSAERQFRVAIMGDEVSLASANPGGALAQLESALPSLKVFDLSAPQAGPREYARNQIQRARKLNLDLVLTFVSVGDDIASESPRVDLFDWRSLCVSRLMRRYVGWPQAPAAAKLGSNGQAVAAVPAAGAWETYVAACGPQLAVCRKPIDAAMQRRWKTTLGYLDELSRGCREAGIQLALVIAPSPLQTNRPLLEAACRRQGYAPSEIDLDLPQRRLAAYAADRNLPAFDLLPALRSCPEQPFIHQGWRWNARGNAAAAQALSGWLQSTFTEPFAARRPAVQQHAADDDPAMLVARKP